MTLGGVNWVTDKNSSDGIVGQKPDWSRLKMEWGLE